MKVICLEPKSTLTFGAVYEVLHTYTCEGVTFYEILNDRNMTLSYFSTRFVAFSTESATPEDFL